MNYGCDNLLGTIVGQGDVVIELSEMNQFVLEIRDAHYTHSKKQIVNN